MLWEKQEQNKNKIWEGPTISHNLIRFFEIYILAGRSEIRLGKQSHQEYRESQINIKVETY